EQDACAVTRIRLAAGAAAVAHVAEHRVGVGHDGVAALTLDVGDDAHAARVALVGRVVETHRSNRPYEADWPKLPRAVGGRHYPAPVCQKIKSRLPLHWS